MSDFTLNRIIYILSVKLKQYKIYLRDYKILSQNVYSKQIHKTQRVYKKSFKVIV